MSKHAYTYYTPGSGEIIATSTGEPQPDLDKAFSKIPGEYPGNLFYVANGQPKEKRKFPVTAAGLKLSNVPPRTQADVNGEVFEVNDGTLEIVRPGTLPVRIVLRHINYLTEEFSL